MIVSGGSFLTIVIGAHLLGLSDQGKLGYVLTAYTLTILLNVALFIYAAPLVSSHTPYLSFYRHGLQIAQIVWAILLAAIIAAGFSGYGSSIGWEISAQEAVLLWLFLAAQQTSDYCRRASYVFQDAAAACKVSMVTLGLRIVLLLLVRPADLSGVLIVLIASALVGASPTLFHTFATEHESIALSQVKALAREHLHLSRWSVLQALFNWIAFLQAFVLGYFYSAESVAVLVSIRSIGNAANVLLEQLETIVPVWFAHLAGKIGLAELKLSTGRLLVIGMGIWFLGVLLILVFGKLAIRLILGDRFEPYSYILLIAWFGNGIYFVNRVAGLYWRAQKNVKAEFFGSLGGLVFFMGSVPIIAMYGLEGAAWGYVLVPIGTAGAPYLYAGRAGLLFDKRHGP